ncbi:MAG: hypothetical protein RLZZ426_822 [Actinomycetota bacterium]
MCAALTRPQFLTTLALNNPGLSRSPMRRLIPAVRGTIRFGVGVALCPLQVLAHSLRVLGQPKAALSLLLLAAKVPLFIPAVARMLVATYLDLGQIKAATKLAAKLILFSPQPHGDRRFSRVWSLHLSTLPNWLPYINLEPTTDKSQKIVVITSPQAAMNNPALISKLENEFQATQHVIDIESPRPLPVVAESILDGIVTDIAVSESADAKAPDIVIALLADSADHLVALSALSLGTWANAAMICVTAKQTSPSTGAAPRTPNEYTTLSIKQCEAVTQKFDHIGGPEDITTLIANIRGASR